MTACIRHRIWLVLNILAVVAVLCFIFGNSLLDRQQSASVSSSVTDVVKPIVYPILDVSSKEPVTDDMIHTVVRKLAHVTEFAVLSSLSTLLLFQLCGTLRTYAIGYLFFGTLFSAVTDEFIQSFTGRGSSVRDVLIDFGGAAVGIAVTALLLSLIVPKFQKRK